MDSNDVAEYEEFATRYRKLRAWATDAEVRRAWQIEKRLAAAAVRRERTTVDSIDVGPPEWRWMPGETRVAFRYPAPQGHVFMPGFLNHMVGKPLNVKVGGFVVGAAYLREVTVIDDGAAAWMAMDGFTTAGTERLSTVPGDYWVFTFGGGHSLRSSHSKLREYLGWSDRADPTGVNVTLSGGEFPIGLPLRGRYVRIPARDQTHAREIMFAIFGDVWGMQYGSEEAAEVELHHLTELDVTEALAELRKMGACQ